MNPFEKIRPIRMYLLLLICGSGLMAQNSSGSASPLRATHILGFENTANNANGSLAVRDHALHFQKDQGPDAQINVTSIQDVSLGEQDKQIGGAALAVGRAATPYGGGRLIALFSHKKYDTVTVEYQDAGGGFHGAIFQLAKGQAQVLKSALVAEGAHLTQADDKTMKSSPEAK